MSEKRTLSPSPSKGMTRGLIGKLQDTLGHGLSQSKIFRPIPTERLDQFIKGRGADLSGRLVEVAEMILQDFLGCHQIGVNYDVPKAITVAINANGFGKNVFMGIPVENIPIIGHGQAEHQVREVHFGRKMYNRDLPDALKARGMELGFPAGFKFVDPLTALLYALKLPDRQKQYPLGILFNDAVGGLCSLYLIVYGGGRCLRVYRGYPGHDWDDDVRFLAVREVQPLAA